MGGNISDRPNRAIGETSFDLPVSSVWRAQLVDAAILAASVAARATPPVHPAARMALMSELRRSGLTGSPPSIDVLGRFDRWMPELTDERSTRRLLARHMNLFVGTPWAGVIVRIAEAVALASHRAEYPARDLAQSRALGALRVSLGIGASDACAPAR